MPTTAEPDAAPPTVPTALPSAQRAPERAHRDAVPDTQRLAFCLAHRCPPRAVPPAPLCIIAVTRAHSSPTSQPPALSANGERLAGRGAMAVGRPFFGLVVHSSAVRCHSACVRWSILSCSQLTG